MPELPEVETTLRGVLPHLLGKQVLEVIVRDGRLRQPVPESLHELAGQSIRSGRRRAKYLLFEAAETNTATAPAGTALIHLGMSGSLRLTEHATEPRKHDHVILRLSSGMDLRYHDPRRFGCFLWLHEPEPERTHPLLRDLGPEPLGAGLTAQYLFQYSRGRKSAVKVFIMDAQVVVGIGNIYASEALFMAGVRPTRAAGKVTLAEYARIASAAQEVLEQSIRMGGTTLRDFVREDGQPGYFKQSLRVYDRAGEPCRVCGTPIEKMVLGQRATYYCPRCQPR